MDGDGRHAMTRSAAKSKNRFKERLYSLCVKQIIHDREDRNQVTSLPFLVD